MVLHLPLVPGSCITWTVTCGRKGWWGGRQSALVVSGGTFTAAGRRAQCGSPWVLGKYLLQGRRREAAWWERTAAREGAAAVAGTGRESARPAGRVRWSRVRIRAAELSGLAPPPPAASLVSRVAPLFRASFSLLLLPPELVRRMGRGPVSPRSPWGGSRRRSQHLSLVATFGQVCV